MAKSNLRRELKKRLSQMTAREIVEQSDVITKKVGRRHSNIHLNFKSDIRSYTVSIMLLYYNYISVYTSFELTH